MGTKPGIALIGLVLIGITLSGCESSSAYQPAKMWGQNSTMASAPQTTNPVNSPPSAWNNQPRMNSGSPLSSAGSAVPATQSARVTDPAFNPVSPTSPLNAVGAQQSSPTVPSGFSSTRPSDMTAPAPQPTAQIPPMPSTTTSSVDQTSRITIPGNATAPTIPPSWPTTIPAATGSGMKTPE